jgi:hypothetical protein
MPVLSIISVLRLQVASYVYWSTRAERNLLDQGIGNTCAASGLRHPRRVVDMIQL